LPNMQELNKNFFSCRDIREAGQVKKITWVGIIVNIALSAVKFVLGVLGRSQAVVADAVHSLSDLSTDLAVLFGVKFWMKPADEEHPYGHRRIELVVTGAIGIVLLGVAVGIGHNSLTTLRSEHIKQPGLVALAGALISIVFKEMLYRWTLVVGKRAKSQAVIANAWHHRSDALSSIPVAVAVAAASINEQWSFLDHLGAFVVCLFIFYASWKIMRDVFSNIVDTGAPKRYRSKIKALVSRTEGVKSIHALRSRRIGSGWFIDLHIQVDGEMTVAKGHDIAKAVKRNLLNRDPDVLDVLVHLEPYEGR